MQMTAEKRVIPVSDSDLLEYVQFVLKARGLMVSEFASLAEASDLEDDELRDLWLAVGSAIPDLIE